MTNSASEANNTWNAFPSSNNLGGTDDAGAVSPSTEGLWDALLSRGKIVWGVGSDEVSGTSPRYTFKGDESYVRAAITDSDGRRAWTQPVFLDGRKTAAR